ncbi:lipid-binding SYLF domain-containing protein [Planktosalinus lacus]|nr:lipid-binding SYLF domain-containing protein [Planktosalinus lacus]
MKKTKLILVTMLFMSMIVFAQKSDKDKEIISDAETVKVEFIALDRGLESQFDNATAYVIFPNVGKGAVVVGAASGHGAVYKNGKLVGMASMKQLDVGAQIGGKAYSEVIFFNSEEAFKKLKNNELELTSQVAAIAVEEGTSMNTKFTDGLAVFVKPKAGLMAEVSVGGQKFEFRPLDRYKNK